MTNPEPARALRAWTALLLAALGGVGLVTLASAVVQRVGSPWPLEWMEGASLEHALRLLKGEPLYARPRAEFIPYLYPPLGYLPMALACALFSPTLASARAASLACTLVTLWLLGRTATRAARHPLAGLCTAGLFAMGYGYTGGFLDLARVDACFLLFLATGVERLSAGRPRAALVALALSTFTKQHGLLLLFALSASLFRAREERGFLLGTWTAVIAAGAVLEVESGGFFSRYVLELPLSHGLEPELLLSYLVVDVLLYLPVLVLATGLELRQRLPRLGDFDALLLAGLLASALGRAHPGGHDNVRLPGFLLLCSVAGPWLARQVLHGDKPVRWALALALQLGVLWQPPGLHAPSRTGDAEFAALQGALQRCAPGGLRVALDHALLTGEPFLHTMALSDLRLGRDRELARLGTGALLGALRSKTAPDALAVGERFAELDRVLAQHYDECALVRAPELATGYQPGLRVRGGDRVQVVYRRKPVADSRQSSTGRHAPPAGGRVSRSESRGAPPHAIGSFAPLLVPKRRFTPQLPQQRDSY